MVIVDTNIIIDHLRLKSSEDSILAKLALQYPGKDLSISIITVQEIMAGQSTRKLIVRSQIATTLSSLTILDYSIEIAKLAGQIARDSGNKMQFADAAIAATALVNHASLATLNTKDFHDIPRLKLFAF